MSIQNVQNVSSAPDYINQFIHTNRTDLENIYEEGIHNFQSGCLGFQCSQETNKMNVQFMNDEMMCETLQKESWVCLKNNIPKDKKLFFVMDEDLNSVFLIYI
jgi:hypothetical protein